MMFTEHDFLDRFGAAREAGFEAVEFLFPYDHPAEAIGAAPIVSTVATTAGMTRFLKDGLFISTSIFGDVRARCHF